MVTICQQCGDIGFANAFVYCVKCLDFAVHRYCLNKLPGTFDEFVYWFCEDCKPEVVKQCPVEKQSSKYDQLTGSKINLKKKEAHEKLDFDCAHLADEMLLKEKSDSTCPVVATELWRHQSSPTQQFLESHTKPDLNERARLVGDRELEIKLKKKSEKGITCSVAGTVEQWHQSSSSQKSCEGHRDLELTRRAMFARDCSSLEKESKKEKGITSSVAETEDQRRGSSSSWKPREVHTKLHTKPDLNERVQLVGDCQLKIKLKNKNEKGITCSVAGTEEQRHQSSSSQKSCEGHRKLELTTRHGSVRDCSSLEKESKKRKGITSSVAETQEQRRGSSSSWKPHTKLGFTDCAELTGDCSLLKIKLKWKKEDGTPSASETEEQKPQSRHPQHSYGELEEGSRLDEEVGCVRIDVSQTAPRHFSSTIEHNYHLHAQPIIDPIWRGSFSICTKKYGIIRGVVAHLSTKACPKVYEEASLLPTLLCAEMLPIFDVWPRSFERAEPSDDNIALYFFPQNKTYKIVFDSLVGNMMRGELAMRVTVKDAELLVFTSNKLPLQYWKFQGKYYLWGVFKGKQASSTHQVSYNLMAQNNKNECDVHSNSANALGMTEREAVKAKTLDARSGPRPLNKGDRNSPEVSDEHEREMELELELELEHED